MRKYSRKWAKRRSKGTSGQRAGKEEDFERWAGRPETHEDSSARRQMLTAWHPVEPPHASRVRPGLCQAAAAPPSAHGGRAPFESSRRRGSPARDRCRPPAAFSQQGTRAARQLPTRAIVAAGYTVSWGFAAALCAPPIPAGLCSRRACAGSAPA
eukprot:449704-Pleurochrysis_carterae.AAC.2